MLEIKCPVCGVVGEEGDFHAGGQAHIKRPATHDPHKVSDEEQRDYLFMRHNPKGLHFERWRCDRGCGKWFHAARDTVSLEFKAYYGIQKMPPMELMKQATGYWAEFFAPYLKQKRSTSSTRPKTSRKR
jgi:sarcosine oxidase subunit delta